MTPQETAASLFLHSGRWAEALPTHGASPDCWLFPLKEPSGPSWGMVSVFPTHVAIDLVRVTPEIAERVTRALKGELP